MHNYTTSHRFCFNSSDSGGLHNPIPKGIEKNILHKMRTEVLNQNRIPNHKKDGEPLKKCLHAKRLEFVELEREWLYV